MLERAASTGPPFSFAQFSALSQILWLASYPKSGNTWLRTFLGNVQEDGRVPFGINRLPEVSFSDARLSYYTEAAGRPMPTLTGPELAQLRPLVHRLLATARPGVVPVKTHLVNATLDGVPTITPEVTAAAIYIVRNPLDVVVSFADHYGLPLDRAVRAIGYPELELKPGVDTVRQRIGDWSGHVRSWLAASGLKMHVVRYEDMLASPARTFGDILDFLGIAVDRERLRRAIRRSSFRVVAEQERQQGFVEKAAGAERFFRRGVAGGWRRELPVELAEVIIGQHGPVMRQMGYLTADGRPTT